MKLFIKLSSRVLLASLLLSVMALCALPRISFADTKEHELFLVAQKAFDDGFYDVAIRYIEEYLIKYPDSSQQPEAKLLLGQCFFFKSQYLQAFETFQSIVKYAEIKDATLFWLGETYLKGADHAQAEKYFKEVINNYASSVYAPQAYYSLGWTFYEQKNYQVAQSTFLSLTLKYPSHHLSEDAFFKAAECNYNLANYDAAIKSFQEYVFRYPQSTRHDQAYFYIGESYYYKGSYQNALEYYSKTIEISNNTTLSIMAKVSKGWSHLKLRQFEEAEQTLDVALKMAQERNIMLDDIYLGKANLFTEMGKAEEALGAYTEVLAKFPKSTRIAEAYLGKANILYSMQKYSDAINAYQTTIEKFETDPAFQETIEKAYFGLAWSHLKHGNIDKSIETFKAVQNKAKSEFVKISALSQIGDAYQDINQLDKALEVYDQILKDFPKNIYTDYIQYRQGITLLKLDKVDAAIFSLQSIPVNFPESKYINDAQYYLAVAYFKNESWGSAKQYAEKFIQKSDPLNEFLAQASYILALSQFNLNDFDGAIKTFENIIKDHSSDLSLVMNAELGIAQSLSQQGKTKEAISKFQYIIDKHPKNAVAEESLLLMAEHYLGTSEYDQATRYFLQLIKQFPDGEKVNFARYELGQTYEREEKLDEALEQYKSVTNPRDQEIVTKAKLAIADIFSRKIETTEAIAQYRKIAENSPDFKRDALLKIAKIYHAEKKYTEEIDAYEKALNSAIGRSRIKDVELQFYIADSYELLNEPDKAVEAYLKIPYLYADEKLWAVKAYLRTARIFEDSEKWENAKNIYNKVVQYHMDESKYAQERLDWIKNNIKLND